MDIGIILLLRAPHDLNSSSFSPFPAQILSTLVVSNTNPLSTPFEARCRHPSSLIRTSLLKSGYIESVMERIEICYGLVMVLCGQCLSITVLELSSRISVLFWKITKALVEYARGRAALLTRALRWWMQ